MTREHEKEKCCKWIERAALLNKKNALVTEDEVIKSAINKQYEYSSLVEEIDDALGMIWGWLINRNAKLSNSVSFLNYIAVYECKYFFICKYSLNQSTLFFNLYKKNLDYLLGMKLH